MYAAFLLGLFAGAFFGFLVTWVITADGRRKK